MAEATYPVVGGCPEGSWARLRAPQRCDEAAMAYFDGGGRLAATGVRDDHREEEDTA